MKNKIKIIAIAILILTLLILVIFFGGEKKTDEKKLIEERQKIVQDLTEKRIANLPKSEVVEEEDPSTGTGAIYISPTRDEFDEIMAIRKIKDESPIETEDFKVDFSYASNLIEVEFVNKENEFNMDSFEDWKWDEGYGVIGDEYWDIKL